MRAAWLVALAVFCTTAAAGSFVSGARDGVAIQGYDAVAYFTQTSAVRGTANFAHEWAGTVWFFSSAENREAFAAQPEKYAPQYGGHCALSVANGKSARGSGEAWHVESGKLYLNYDQSVQARWQRNRYRNISEGDRWWPGIKRDLEAK